MGRFKNQQEEFRARKRAKNNQKKISAIISSGTQIKTPVQSRSYKIISDRVIRINFGPKPKTVNARAISEKLGGKWFGHSCTVCCPSHDDTTPSLSVSEDSNGNCLLYCHAGCSYGEVVKALINKHKILPKRERLRHPALGYPAREFDYYDKDGRITFKVCRFNKTDGHKTYRGYLPSERRWGFPDARVLYNLPRLLKNVRANVLIVEGEKTADAAQKLFPDYVVTTWPGGANADLSKIDWSPLNNRNIIIFADNDAAGKQVAFKIQEIVGGEVSSPSAKSPTTKLPKGWDLADVYEEKVDQIREQLEEIFSRIHAEPLIHDASTLYEKNIPDLIYTVGNLYPEGVALLAGRPKIGKSFHMCQLCVAVARGDEFLGRPTRKSKVLYISFEDSERRLKKRLCALPHTTEGSLRYALEWPRPSQGGYEQLEEAINEHGFKLIVIDTLARFVGINKRGKGAGDGYSDDYEAISRLVDLAHKKSVCLVFVHHLRKARSNEDYFDEVAGSTGLTAAPDTIIVLKKKGIGNKATLMARGRDIQETMIELEMVNGIWKSNGDAEELATTSSPIKKRILQTLSKKNGQTPVEIAKQIGENKSSVRVYVRKLVASEKLFCENGRYFLTEGITE